MYKIIKYSWDSRCDHFFTSDWHNYHDPHWENPIWIMRGYSSFKESYIDVQKKINSKVGIDQHLWMMGDSFLSTTDELALEWLDGIKCKNIMMLFGNHESQIYRIYKSEVVRQFGRDDIEVYPIKMGNVTFLGNHQEITIGKTKIVMNHFPLRGHNQASRGSWHLHGHSHNNDETRNADYPLGKVLDCSWDWKNDIWTFDEIVDIMSTKSIHITDHHDKDR